MRITSIAFNDQDPVPPRYKGNVNPPIDISGVPEQAKSLALIMHDPDAVSGDYVHWTIWDIDPRTTTILEESTPSGATAGLTTAGMPGYVGPRPPEGSGRHRYIFELYALDTVLDLLPATPLDDLSRHIKNHALDKAELTGVVDA
jgi:Raf kinase inhibitor-like YbhB/YbcL family protein